MAVVSDYYYGPTHVIVHDDFVVPDEEVAKIIERIGINASRALMVTAIKESEENEKAAL